MKYRYRDPHEMKDSGVEWLGMIPKEWETVIGKYIYENKKTKNSGSIKDVISLTLNGVIDRDTENLEGLQPESFDGYQEFYKNNLVFKLIDLQNKKTSRVGICHKDGLMSPAYIRLQERIRTCNKFYYYNYFDYYNKYIYNFLGSVGVRSAINANDLLDMEIIKINYNEQEKIADFLDQKTAEFDNIIAKKQAFIDKLTEAKKSLISEVVTGKKKITVDNGKLIVDNRKVEDMKDSGVEWLGTIPKEWGVSKLKLKCKNVTDGAHISPELKDGIYPFLSVKDLKNEKLNFNDCLLTSKENYEYLKRNLCEPQFGDVLISKDGTIGKTISIDFHKEFVVASSFVILKPTKDINFYYLEYMLMSSSSQNQIFQHVKGAALPRISITLLKEVYISFSKNYQEQQLIVNFLDEKTAKIDNTIEKIKLQIEKLKEAKQSLISEAVTGKIEVM